MTVGELIKKLQTYDASDEVIVAINTGDCGIPGRLDSVVHNADKHIVRLIHICVDPDVYADATELDAFIDAALSGEMIRLDAFKDPVLSGKM